MQLNEKEKIAADNAGKCGGEFLESIKKFDVMTMTPEEWKTFVEVICWNYHMNVVCPF